MIFSHREENSIFKLQFLLNYVAKIYVPLESLHNELKNYILECDEKMKKQM